MTTEKTQTKNEEQIRQLKDEMADALRHKNVDGVISKFADQSVPMYMDGSNKVAVDLKP
jgi:ketosteroid isomerase-like protein